MSDLKPIKYSGGAKFVFLLMGVVLIVTSALVLYVALTGTVHLPLLSFVGIAVMGAMGVFLILAAVQRIA
ncbi:MAG TPA: hypothetical protein VHE09_00755 [Rhizomicrobium sp.]|jgi:hypothetical protein|nr:hypothetical protein [Rhizomicrobium sp.]